MHEEYDILLFGFASVKKDGVQRREVEIREKRCVGV